MTFRIAPVETASTNGTTRQQLDGFQAKLGTVPAMGPAGGFLAVFTT